MEKIIAIEVKKVYGVEMIYPANAVADVFAELAGKKTLSKVDMKLIKSLGYEVMQVSKELVF